MPKSDFSKEVEKWEMSRCLSCNRPFSRLVLDHGGRKISYCNVCPLGRARTSTRMSQQRIRGVVHARPPKEDSTPEFGMMGATRVWNAMFKSV